MASKKETSSDHQTTEYGDQRIERGAGGEIHQVAAREPSREPEGIRPPDRPRPAAASRFNERSQ